jgi:xanthine dehydrogenase YagT iron-sulfur-binding subunit
MAPRTATTRFVLDGTEVELVHDVRVTLLDALRNLLGATGPKKGCDRGQCGACTVHLDGRTALACLVLTATVDGAQVRTVASLASDPELAAVQRAFVEHDGLQCGFCTPGQLMSAAAAVRERAVHSDEEIREFMSGNLCRCAAYPNIAAAVRHAIDATRPSDRREDR